MPRPSSGFTLLELMTAIAVMGILLGLGVPAFTDIVRNNQIAAQSANLVEALHLARSEALKRGVRVSVCAALDAAGDSCATAADWSNGWIAFSDDFGAMGVLDGADQAIQNWPAPANGVSITNAPLSVTFARGGRAEFAQSFEVTKEGCKGDQKRGISVLASGRIGLVRSACP